ncbi:hypothetical protein KA005_36975 [bacterium]|nr:hypothetical protein [bacterium]
MRVLLSTWKPWNNVSVSLQDRVDMAKVANAEICMKGSNASYIYGPNTWNIFKVWPYKGKSNDDLELICKQNNLKVQLWDFPYLQYPTGSANAVNESITRWNPQDVWLDVEGGYAKNYPTGTGPFLRGLGNVSVRFWLQSYRWPYYHPKIKWLKWLKYKDPLGRYIIHGLGPQAYPMWSKDWLADFKRMVDEYEKLLVLAGRPDIPWFPTLPTFSERGWTPSVVDVIAGCDYLKERLGDRLVGLNFWRQGFLFKPEYAPILHYINMLYEPDLPPPPPVRDDWFTDIQGFARASGYPPPNPIPPPAHTHGE